MRQLSERTDLYAARVRDHMQVLVDTGYAIIADKSAATLENPLDRRFYTLSDKIKNLKEALEKQKIYNPDLVKLFDDMPKIVSLLGIPAGEVHRVYDYGIEARLLILQKIRCRPHGVTPSELLSNHAISRRVENASNMSYHLSKLGKLLRCEFDPVDKRRRRYFMRVEDSEIEKALKTLEILTQL